MTERIDHGQDDDHLAQRAEELADKRGYSYDDAWAEVTGNRPQDPTRRPSVFASPNVSQIHYEKPSGRAANLGTENENDPNWNRQPTDAEKQAADYAGPGRAAAAAIAATRDPAVRAELLKQEYERVAGVGVLPDDHDHPVQEALFPTPEDDR